MAEKKDKKPEKKPLPESVTVTRNKINSWVGLLETQMEAFDELPGDDAKGILAVLERNLSTVDQMALHLAREIAKMQGASPMETNPLVRVTAVNITKGLQNAARTIELCPWSPNAYAKAAKDMKAARESLEALVTVMTGAGVADCVVLPGAPLTDEEGHPLVPPEKA